MTDPWPMNETRPLNYALPESSWIHRDLLTETDQLVQVHGITGTATIVHREPDGDGDFLSYYIRLDSQHTSNISLTYVLRDYNEHAYRTPSVAEAVAELAHGDAFGDEEMGRSLRALIGDADAKSLGEVAFATL